MKGNIILQGDALERLRELPDGCVQMCVTSPPYWNLRDYGVAGQLGLEPTPAAYVARMVEVFREVKRVLRDDGTLWLNIGDSYQSGRGEAQGIDPKQPTARRFGVRPTDKRVPGLKPKDLVGIPWMLAFALREDGWWLRSEITWCKPNPMPESVQDRPTSATEKIFLLAKSERYYYDGDAIREPPQESSFKRISQASFDSQTGGPKDPGTGNRSHRRTLENYRERIDKQRGHGRRHDGFNDRWDQMSKEEQQALGRNKRNYWVVATAPYAEAHFATFPRKLIEPCILAGSSPQACEHCGAPWRRVVEAVGGTIGKSWHPHADDMGAGMSQVPIRVGSADGGSYRRIERGWEPTCRCEGNTGAARSIVLDPFMGSGTTALVALQWQRDWLGIELNPAYIKMAERRLATVQPRLFASA